MEELAAALRDMHGALAVHARREHEREHGGLFGSDEFLRLLVSEPEFAWIRSLSELMADLDVLLKAGPSATEDEAAAVRAEVERLIGEPDRAEAPQAFAAFAARLRAYARDDPLVAMALVRVRQALRRLPEARSLNAAEALHERHRWGEVRRHRR